jgi:hypothetical protein
MHGWWCVTRGRGPRWRPLLGASSCRTDPALDGQRARSTRSSRPSYVSRYSVRSVFQALDDRAALAALPLVEPARLEQLVVIEAGDARGDEAAEIRVPSRSRRHPMASGPSHRQERRRASAVEPRRSVAEGNRGGHARRDSERRDAGGSVHAGGSVDDALGDLAPSGPRRRTERPGDRRPHLMEASLKSIAEPWEGGLRPRDGRRITANLACRYQRTGGRKGRFR